MRVRAHTRRYKRTGRTIRIGTHNRAGSNAHRYGAHAIDSRGHVLGEWTGDNLRAVMAEGDRRFPKGGKAWSVSVRDDRTSDGTVHGTGRGRVVATREPRTLYNGDFHNDWLMD